MSFILVVHVNSYVLVSGYFQYNKEFKLSKFFSISNLQIFYLYLMIVIFSLLGINFEKVDLINRIFITFFRTYWFITAYLLLYLISPFLNILIKHMNKKTHFYMLLVLLFIVGVIMEWLRQKIFKFIYNRKI